MKELKDIVYDSIKTLSEKKEKSNRICSESSFKSFYFFEIFNKIHAQYPDMSFSKKDIKKQLFNLTRDGDIEIISTCIPKYLLKENYEKYYVDKFNVIIKFTIKSDKQQLLRLFSNFSID